MNLQIMINTRMGRTLLVVLFLSLLLPILIMLFSRATYKGKIYKVLIIAIYVICVAYFTLLDRKVGEKGQINLAPFWTYQYFSLAQYRWQIYLNILLFLPLGFLLPWSSKANILLTLFSGLFLSIFIELIQYIFSLGMCETDDVIHNSLGTLIGYNYFRLICRFDCKYGDRIWSWLLNLMLTVKNKGSKNTHNKGS